MENISKRSRARKIDCSYNIEKISWDSKAKKSDSSNLDESNECESDDKNQIQAAIQALEFKPSVFILSGVCVVLAANSIVYTYFWTPYYDLQLSVYKMKTSLGNRI